MLALLSVCQCVSLIEDRKTLNKYLNSAQKWKLLPHLSSWLALSVSYRIKFITVLNDFQMLDQINCTWIVYLGLATSSICATGQLFTAMQPVRQLGCSVCSAFFQCQGAFNAIRRCRNSALDALTVSAIIAPSADWQSYLSSFINTSPNPTAAADGLATALTTAALSSCNLKFGLPLGCGPLKATSCRSAYTLSLVI